MVTYNIMIDSHSSAHFAKNDMMKSGDTITECLRENFSVNIFSMLYHNIHHVRKKVPLFSTVTIVSLGRFLRFLY